MRIIPGASHSVSGPLITSAGQLEPLDAFAVVPLSVVITLTVNTAAQASLGKNFFVDLPLLSELHLLLEDVDLPC